MSAEERIVKVFLDFAARRKMPDELRKRGASIIRLWGDGAPGAALAGLLVEDWQWFSEVVIRGETVYVSATLAEALVARSLRYEQERPR